MVSRSGKGTSSTMALSCSQAKIWVKAHYERHEDGVVAKSVMYKHYEDFCREQGRNIMETSIFGRVVKSVFPDVTIRRLGGRDNLKYYYCGIHVQECSPHVLDNDMTMRPKRRLRKRELVTDKTEVHNCLRWLHGNYVSSLESSVVKTDVYDGYVHNSKMRGVEALSIQYFGMVINHAFPNVTKRKLGPRTNQQKYYFGIQERPNPVPMEMVPREYLYVIDDVLNSKYTYRDTVEHQEEEEEEEYSCRSPGSDMSDIASASFQVAVGSYEPDLSTIPCLPEWREDSYMVGKSEPVDYSLSHLKLKDEPPEEEEDDLCIKEEPLDLHVSRDIPVFIDNPKVDNSLASSQSYSSSSSPSSSISCREKILAKKIYKPRFHYQDEDSSWNEESVESEVREEPIEIRPSFEENVEQLGYMLKRWILENFEECRGIHLNRDQAYEIYENQFKAMNISPLPLTYFDETMLKTFQGVVTMIHPSGKTFYEGIRIKGISSHYGCIEEMMHEENESNWEDAVSTMEMSPGEEANCSPATFEDEEEVQDEPDADVEPYMCPQVEDEMNSTPEVLRDGKFYLRNWLRDNFETLPDSCVLKADAYKYYEIFSRKIQQTPFEMNVFGKIVRQVFPNVTIRRLGGRLKPQYHYCGISVKTTSELHQFMSGKDPAQRSRKKEIATDNRCAEVVIEFLKTNYEAGKDRIIMKSEVFDAYNAFCSSIGENPVTVNYFGKLVKHCFPQVEVRKFGGRSEPTWYYYGLIPWSGSGLRYSSSTHILYPETVSREVLSQHHHDSAMMHPANRGLSPPQHVAHDMNNHISRSATSPIPISLGPRIHSQMEPFITHPFDSPSNVSHQNTSMPIMMNNSPSIQLRETFDDFNRLNSPAESSHFFREGPNPTSPPEKRCIARVRSPYGYPEVPSKTTFSRSPLQPQQLQGFMFVQTQNSEPSYPTESLNQHHIQKRPHLGGQVVPSQTPPNFVMSTTSAAARGASKHPTVQILRSPKQSYGQQGEYEQIYQMQME